MTTRRRLGCVGLVMLLAAGAASALAFLPTTTRKGVNYRVTALTIPAYIKTLDFLQRHYQYQLLVTRICAATTSDTDCALALFEWIHTNVRPMPQGWPIIDDHPLHIIIRGYGTSDQAADIFSILAVYAGMPAFFRSLTPDGQLLDLAFVRLAGRWVPFDVRNHVAFRSRNGALAGIDELVRDPSLVDEQTNGVSPAGVPYSTFISPRVLEPFETPDVLRGELQQPWPRIRYELRRALGFGT